MKQRLTARQRRLVANNLGLVHAVLKRMRIGGRGREEAQAEGMLALCEAARSYTPGRASFSTWATLRVGWRLSSWLDRETAYRLGCSVKAVRSMRTSADNRNDSPAETHVTR